MRPETFLTNAKRLLPLVKNDQYAQLEAKQLILEAFSESSPFYQIFGNQTQINQEKLLEIAIRYVENVRLPDAPPKEES
jgi:hypothetical protein